MPLMKFDMLCFCPSSNLTWYVSAPDEKRSHWGHRGQLPKLVSFFSCNKITCPPPLCLLFPRGRFFKGGRKKYVTLGTILPLMKKYLVGAFWTDDAKTSLSGLLIPRGRFFLVRGRKSVCAFWCIPAPDKKRSHGGHRGQKPKLVTL